MWDKANILVTGGSGLVGFNLVTRLRSMGCNIRSVYHRKDPPIAYDGVDYVKADLQIRDDCRLVVRDIDYVFHVAASTSGAAAISATPMIHVTPNILIDTHLFDACYQEGVKKVLWTASTTGYPDLGGQIIEEDQMFQGEPYPKYYMTGWTKRFTELLCNMYSHKLSIKMPILVLRPTNIYGPHDKFDFERCHVIPSLIRKIVERQNPLEIWGTGDDERDFVYIDDMIDAIIMAMEKLQGYDPVNIGFGKTYTVKEALKTMLAIDNYSPEVVYNSDKPSMIPVRRVSIAKAQRLLNFNPKISLEEGLRKTIDFYRALRH
jgi:GDP-L-fucose synthase